MIPAMKDPALWLLGYCACLPGQRRASSVAGQSPRESCGAGLVICHHGGLSSLQYGAAHRARRKQAIARLVPGTPCPVSGPPMHPTPSAAVAVGLPAAFGEWPAKPCQLSG
jgi:hypothetical protein